MTLPQEKIKKTKARSDNPDPVDVHAGYRLRVRRNLLGLSQEQLGKELGLTFQQIQKYERGTNRMGASRLHQISRILSVPVSYFFEEIVPSPLSSIGVSESGQISLEGTSSLNQNQTNILHRRETLELVRAYYRIQDAKQRRKIYELIKSMAEEA